MPTCYQKTLPNTEVRIREFIADRRARNFERKEWLQPTTMDPDDEHWAQRAHALFAEGADNVPRMEPPPPPPQGPLCISSASVKAVFDGVPSDPMTRFSTLWRWRQARSNRRAEHIVTRKHALPANPRGGVTTLGPTLTRH